MKKILLLSLFFFSCFAFGQNVKLKDGFVFINKEKCMKYTSKSMSYYNNFYSLDDKKLFYIDGAKSKYDKTYFKIQFSGSDEFVTLDAMAMNFKTDFIEKLIEEGVIDSKSCQINLENFKNFKIRYHKDYSDTDTTVIINQNSTPSPQNSVNIGVGIGK